MRRAASRILSMTETRAKRAAPTATFRKLTRAERTCDGPHVRIRYPYFGTKSIRVVWDRIINIFF